MTNIMKIPFALPDVGEAEIQLVAEVIRSGWITTGPRTKEFERRISEFCGTSRTVCLNSATASLELTMRLLGIGPGDEVITSPYTYTATASAICHTGATPVLVDVAPGSFEMNYDLLADAVSTRTKAVIPVDLGGVVCDYDTVFSIVDSLKHKFHPNGMLQQAIGRIAVIADAAHAFGAARNGRMAGNIADFTCFSFHAVKNLTTAEGGALTWRHIDGVDDDWIYKQLQLFSLHGQDRDAMAKFNKLGSWEYDIIAPNYKCNMTDIMAALGLAQLDRYTQSLDRRHDIIKLYNSELIPAGIETLCHDKGIGRSSGHLYLTRIPGIDEERRNEIIFRMAEAGISVNVHYKPLPMMTAYKNMGFDIINYPNAFDMYRNEVTLPLYTRMSDEEAFYVARNFIELSR